MIDVRRARDELVADTRLRGTDFGRALARVLDDALSTAAAALDLGSPGSWALVALGSYARGEQCPGSDIDVMLLRAGGRASTVPDDAGRLWYPLWDAGFVLGHSVRTVKEAVDVADDDIDAMTALLDVRLVAGDAQLVADLDSRMRRLVPKRRARLVERLSAAAAERQERPGPIAEMLAPNLKDGGGGLRDLQAPGWVGWALEPRADAAGWEGGVATLVERGYLRDGDPARLRAARARLLDARVALHRATGTRADQLTLQDQDAVARLVGERDADALLVSLGESARAVTWISADLWGRLRAAEEGPRRRMTGVRELGDGMTLRDGRLSLSADIPIDATRVLVLSARAAELGCQFEQDTLVRIGGLEHVEWTPAGRDAFVALLRAGRRAIGVFETLDHVGVLVRLLPEWGHVRARPQRNAYHRFTVDRHSLEAVAECAALLDPDDPLGQGSDGDVARRGRADVLLLAALLHDIGKGHPGDHSAVGAEVAGAVAERIGLDDAGRTMLVWLVRHHLLLADTATRRDLNDELTVTRFGREVETTSRLDVLYALTIGDSRATGAAAWSASKAELVRELWRKTDSLLAEGSLSSARAVEQRERLRGLVGDGADDYLDAMPAGYAVAFSPEVMAHHRDLVGAREIAVEWATRTEGVIECTVVAADRTGLLATVAGTLALIGFDIASASGYSHHDGMAVEVFVGTDRFGRLERAEDRDRASRMLHDALSGALAVDEPLAERSRRYRKPGATRQQRDVQVAIDLEASTFATVIEVHAPDDVGLLARVAAVFADLGLDVSQALVSTIGDRVVDVFYLRDENGWKLVDRLALERLRATVLARLTTSVTLD